MRLLKQFQKLVINFAISGYNKVIYLLLIGQMLLNSGKFLPENYYAPIKEIKVISKRK